MNRLLSPSKGPRVLHALAVGVVVLLAGPSWLSTGAAADAPSPPATASGEEGLQIEVTKKGLGKEVTIRKGNKEWYLLIEVTSDNTVVVRQEKDKETYLVDESETHDRSLTKAEVDVAIEDFINSVKTQVKQQQKKK